METQISNHLLLNKKLSHSDFLVYATLVSFKDNNKDSVIVKQSTISKRSGLSVPTVCRAIKSLKNLGIIKVLTRYYENSKKKWRKGVNIYVLKTKTAPFIKIPFSIITSKLPSTAFKIMCYLLMKENNGVAYPSLREISNDLNMCVATVISNLKVLISLKLIFKHHYIGKFHSFARNQYTFVKDTVFSKLKYVTLRQGKKLFSVCAFKFTQIDLKSQFEYLKGVETVFT